MHVLIVGDFQEDLERFMLNNSRKFAKGLTRNGHDVLQFSYRNVLLQQSHFRSRTLALATAKGKTDRLLADLARHHQADLVLITAFKLLDGATVDRLRHAVPHAHVVCWYGDMQRGVNEAVAQIARRCDWFLATSAGATLQAYKTAGVTRCAFMPNPADGDVERPYEAGADLASKVLFVGKLRHGAAGQDPTREELIQRLHERGDLTCYGAMGGRPIKGLRYLQAIGGAEMVLSVNAYNDVRLYHSDRLIHCTACGAFTLVKRVPDSELLFEDGKHVCYFESIEECLTLVDKYHAEAAARQRIAAAARVRALEAFGAQKLARHIVELVEQGAYSEPWAEILT